MKRKYELSGPHIFFLTVGEHGSEKDKQEQRPQ
jgi:hypothetical protein